MSAWAKPGVKCVRIDDPTSRYVAADMYGLAKPSKGQILTIIEVRTCRYSGKLLLVFAEIPDVGSNKGWGVEHFRPLVPKKTEAEDLALFTHHLEMGEPVVVGGVSYRSLGRV